MSVTITLAELACKQLVRHRLAAFQRWLSDPGSKLPQAIAQAGEQSWQALELALNGDTLSGKLQQIVTAKRVYAIAVQLEHRLQHRGIPFRRQCLAQLQQARRVGDLGAIQPQALANRFTHFEREMPAGELLAQSQHALTQILPELQQRYPQLYQLLADYEQTGISLWLAAFHYFLRQTAASDPHLAHELQFDALDGLSQQLNQILQLLQERSVTKNELSCTDFTESDALIHQIQPPKRPALPMIHGWSNERVQQLQQETAKQLGQPVVFQPQRSGLAQRPSMAIIPAGSFLMGASETTSDQDRVTITNPFAMGQYAVTFAEYALFAQATERALPDDHHWGRDQRPVINVDWHDACAYCDWLSQQTAKRYRLPTEAEWEYACRAGTSTPFWWGDYCTSAQANASTEQGPYRGQTIPVHCFAPNPWGLYQLHGNVREWTCSDYRADYVGSERCSEHSQELRVVRGGSWIEYPTQLQADFRLGLAVTTWNYDLGFRLVQELD